VIHCTSEYTDQQSRRVKRDSLFGNAPRLVLGVKV
jgi:hypothetical protein